MNRGVTVAFAVVASLLVVASTPATAASAGLAVGSSHSSDSDFGDAAELSDVTITGSGTDAAVALANKEYNVVEDSGDGTAETEITGFVGDDSDGARKSEVKVVPTTSGDFDYLNVSVVGIVNDDFGFTVDIYAVQENPDGTYGEGTLIKSGWDPDFSTGVQSIPLDTPLAASSGENWTIEFVTQSTDGDGTSEWLDLGADGDSGLTGWSSKSGKGGTIIHDRGGDVTLHDSTSKAETGTYVSQNHSASNVEKAWTNIELSNATASVEWQAWDSSTAQWQVVNSSEFSSSGNHTLDISGTSFDKWRVNVSFDKTGANPTAELHDEGVLFQNAAPTPQNASATPQAGGDFSKTNRTLSIQVNDSQFGSVQGDEVTATFYVNGSEVGTETVTSNGTVSTQVMGLPGGEHSWHVELQDSYGATATSDTFTFKVPSNLYIYHETKPSKLVENNSLNLTVRFYPLQAGDSSDVVTRTAKDGVVDLAGLPTGQRFVVTARANNSQYTYRRVVIDSLYESNRIYLLNKSEPSSQVVFELQDPTGQFPPEQTILYVEKPIEVNNTTTYQTIAGDTFGSTGRFPVALQQDDRYRLRVETASGDNERILGSYTVYGATVEPLKIQRISPQSDADAGSIIYGGLQSFNDNASVAVRHRDLAGDVADVTYRVQQDNTVIVANTTTTAETFAHVYPVNSTQATYTVEYWITYQDGSVESGSFNAGQPGGLGDRFNADPQVLSIASWAVILSTMGLLAIANPKLAPTGGTGMASALSLIGTVAIPAPVLGISGAISVLVLFGGGR